MRVVGPEEVHRCLDYPALADAIAAQFRAGGEAPVRHHHKLPVPGAADATLLLMPAWQAGDAVGIKLVTVYPDNGRRGLPAVMGAYLLLDGATGAPRALIDGPALTARRTAAASALAARYLARADAAHLLMVGTGVLAPHLVRAHAAMRPIRHVALWGRTKAKAERLATELAATMPGTDIRAVTDLAGAVADADIVSCATLATEPLIRGAWLRPGQHLDLVGAFTPQMREADDAAVRRARVFVDTRAGALKEGGDLVQAIAAGAIAESDVVGDLFDLVSGAPGRRSDDEITLFKSVGTALEDLAAARLVAERLGL